MTKPNDKFDATRIVVETLKDFDSKDQEMVFRWAAENLGLGPPITSQPAQTMPPATQVASVKPTQSAASTSTAGQDIKSFIVEKNPRSDVQFATAVAYWYQFVAPESERKRSISEEDLLDAFRKADRERPAKPYLTLNNAFHSGLLDRPKKGEFSVNAVGENLVAMTLPGDGSTKSKPAKKGAKKDKKNKRSTKKPGMKPAKPRSKV